MTRDNKPFIDPVELLAEQLAAVHKGDKNTASATAFADVGFTDAMRIQQLTMHALEERAAAIKVAIDSEGRSLSAPIYSGLVATSGTTVEVPAHGFIGIEVEICARLSGSITRAHTERGAEGILPSIESFHIGVELLGSRLDDRFVSGAFGQLADNLNTAGYIWAEAPLVAFPDDNDLSIEVSVNGKSLDVMRGGFPFGGVLEPLITCGEQAFNGFGALERGMLVTTGALCGLIEVKAPATIIAGIAGAEAIEFSLSLGGSGRIATRSA
jgi:2-keto-4-pentenoate hydratase